jgi:hypothetical protein
MPKGRIGLSLDEDVLAILNECGRSETQLRRFRCSGCKAIIESRYDISGSSHGGVPTAVCSGITSLASLDVADTRPTRTEIIQTAIREWYARQEKK